MKSLSIWVGIIGIGLDFRIHRIEKYWKLIKFGKKTKHFLALDEIYNEKKRFLTCLRQTFLNFGINAFYTLE